jgi:hypothetical protein
VLHAGVVDQDVERTDRVLHPRDARGHGILVRDVKRSGAHRRAGEHGGAREPGGRAIDRGWVAPVEHDGATGFQRPVRKRTPDPPTVDAVTSAV